MHAPKSRQRELKAAVKPLIQEAKTDVIAKNGRGSGCALSKDEA